MQACTLRAEKHLQVAVGVRKEEGGQKALLDLPRNSLVENCPISMRCAPLTPEGRPGVGKMLPPLYLDYFKTAEANTQMRWSLEQPHPTPCPRPGLPSKEYRSTQLALPSGPVMAMLGLPTLLPQAPGPSILLGICVEW